MGGWRAGATPRLALRGRSKLHVPCTSDLESILRFALRGRGRTTVKAMKQGPARARRGINPDGSSVT